MANQTVWSLALLTILGAGAPVWGGQSQAVDVRVEFNVKYVASGAIYLNGGRNSGLNEGMTLTVKRRIATPKADGKGTTEELESVGQLRVLSVAEVSAVCEVVSSAEQIEPGDRAYLDHADVQKELEQGQLPGASKYPQIVTFTEGNPLEDEQRAFVPRPPLPEVNRARGQIGFEYGGLQSSGPFSSTTSQLGMFFRADITRINGTYWGLNGYWRGRFDTQSVSGQQATVDDLINRTYHMAMTYNNPNSHWVAGFGRFYLPWASSLDTIDGGYFGRRLNKNTTLGTFAGSTPDPTSWDYSPNQRIAGTFINFQGGSYDSTWYTSTFGVGVTTLGWAEQRQFFFMENSVSYHKVISLYESLQVDRPHVAGSGGANYTGLSRSFVTLHIQPHPRISFDINHNYFRQIPTFNTQLISTGLVDQLLFQGLSAGTRIDLPRKVSLYTDLGRSSMSGDAHISWNQMYGISKNQIWKTGIRGDLRYSKFNSSFGQGDYTSLTFSREIGEAFHGEVMLGEQHLNSAFSKDSYYRSVGANFDWFPGSKYYFNGGFTRQAGNLQNYNQWYIGIGFRFDNLHKNREKGAQ